MGRVFLDTNLFIDAIHRHPEQEILPSLEGYDIITSVLCVHIYCYAFHIKIPSAILASQLKKFILIDFDQKLLNKALEGPTSDLEDNIQLHSSAEADCDFFLTNDKNLLKMKFFGKAQILSTL